MPFQPINFASIPAQQNTFDLTDALMKGYQAGQIPAQTQRAINAQNIVNALKQAQAAKANVQAQNPYYGLPSGNAGQIVAREVIKRQYGDDSPQLKAFDQKWNSDLLKTDVINNYREGLIQNQKYKPWNSMPMSEKEREIAVLAGAGYEPLEGQKLLAEGNTLQDLVKQKGFDINDVEPSYALTSSLKTQSANRKAFASELKTLSDTVSEPASKLNPKFFGYNPDQVIASIKNKDPDEQGKLLAARAIQPELNAIRLKTLGGQVGIGALEHMQDSVLGQTKIFQPLVSPEAYQAMNKYLTQWIDQANNSYENSLKSGSKINYSPQNKVKPMNENTNNSIGTNNSTGTTKVWFNGKSHTIPNDQVKAALEAGGTLNGG